MSPVKKIKIKLYKIKNLRSVRLSALPHYRFLGILRARQPSLATPTGTITGLGKDERETNDTLKSNSSALHDQTTKSLA